MSKAFTRESDDLPDEPVAARQRSPLPPGAKNYVTPQGARRLREELDRLAQAERPRQAASPVNPEARRQLQMLDQNTAPSSDGRVVAPPIGNRNRLCTNRAGDSRGERRNAHLPFRAKRLLFFPLSPNNRAENHEIFQNSSRWPNLS